MRLPTGHTSRWLCSRLETAIPIAEYRVQIPMFCVENSIAPATCSGKYSAGLIIRRKYRKKNGCSKGTIAAAGLRQTHRQPIHAQAGRTRPVVGTGRESKDILIAPGPSVGPTGRRKGTG